MEAGGVNRSYDLERFVAAQNPDIDRVFAELRAGRKQGHWMWYVFPQVKGLGQSSMAATYGISGREEAQAYLDHPILGVRIRECTRLVNLVEGRSVDEIFGYPDNLKFRSSMTLFAQAAPDDPLFAEALLKYFGGQGDPLTLAKLS